MTGLDATYSDYLAVISPIANPSNIDSEKRVLMGSVPIENPQRRTAGTVINPQFRGMDNILPSALPKGGSIIDTIKNTISNIKSNPIVNSPNVNAPRPSASSSSSIFYETAPSPVTNNISLVNNSPSNLPASNSNTISNFNSATGRATFDYLGGSSSSQNISTNSSSTNPIPKNVPPITVIPTNPATGIPMLS